MSGLEDVKSWASEPSERFSAYRLVMRDDEGKTVFRLDKKSVYLLGRSEKDVDIHCPDKLCSRIHACIAHSNDRIYLVDLGSVKGMILDGNHLQPNKRARLTPEQSEFRLGAGPWRFTVESSEPSREDFVYESEAAGNRQASKHRIARNDTEVLENERQRHSNGRDHDDEHRRERSSHRHRSRREDTGSYNDKHENRKPERRRRHSEEATHRSKEESLHRDRRRERERPQIVWPDRDREERKSPSRSRKRNHRHSDSEEDRQYDRYFSRPQAMPVEHKKALLWGNKTAVAPQPTGNTGDFGANRWDTASFENEADREKFNKLMGVKPLSQGGATSHSEQPIDRGGVLSGAAQQQHLHQVESHFMQGLRRADGRKVGLGL